MWLIVEAMQAQKLVQLERELDKTPAFSLEVTTPKPTKQDTMLQYIEERNGVVTYKEFSERFGNVSEGWTLPEVKSYGIKIKGHSRRNALLYTDEEKLKSYKPETSAANENHKTAPLTPIKELLKPRTEPSSLEAQTAEVAMKIYLNPKMSVVEIEQITKMSNPLIRLHLKKLREASAIEYLFDGKKYVVKATDKINDFLRKV
jgi:DNA-binding transcriptional ArsR family regulator